MIKYAILLILIWPASALEHGDSGYFVIDPKRPYVYLQFHHTGAREPSLEGEDPRGLWIELVNNCRIPIRVRVFDLGTDDPAVGLFHEVVLWDRSDIGVPADHSRPLTPKKQAPKGYRWDVSSTADLLPGDRLLFSVPANHVSSDWYIRVPFKLIANEEVQTLEPESFVNFTCNQVPEHLQGKFDCNPTNKLRSR